MRLIFTQLGKDLFIQRTGFNKVDNFYNRLERLIQLIREVFAGQGLAVLFFPIIEAVQHATKLL